MIGNINIQIAPEPVAEPVAQLPQAHYLALDLETEGLDPRTCRILECAWAVLDSELRTIDEHEMVIQCPAGGWRCDAFVTAMHTNNGLFAATEHVNSWALDLLEQSLYNTIELQTWVKGKPILLGNSVHFDLGFLRQHCSRAADLISHRLADVSAWMILYRDLLGLPLPKSPPAHRAMSDVRQSIATAQLIRNKLAGMIDTMRHAATAVTLTDIDRWAVHDQLLAALGELGQ